MRLVRALVDMGLDPAACDHYDRTPLHLAACSGGLALLEFLLGLAKAPHLTPPENSDASQFACEDRFIEQFKDYEAHMKYGVVPAILLGGNEGTVGFVNAVDRCVRARLDYHAMCISFKCNCQS